MSEAMPQRFSITEMPSVVAISDISGGLYCADGLNIDAICDFMEDTGKLLKDYNADGVSHICK